ncbi:MAG TPA: hypothetical protein VK021_09905 [Flavobacteriaceae bacterium]|nr:hypothetical protein [Flavobacteriaceae bacterium]
MAKIIFHCGAHKTASSHLQHNLHLNKEYLEAIGVKYIKLKYHRGLGEKMIRLRQEFNNEDFDANKIMNEIRQIINDSIKGYDKAIISYEGVFGSMNHYNLKTVYPDAETLMKIYKDILQGHEVIPAFAIRNYNDFITSAYKWLLQYDEIRIKFSEFSAQLELNSARWTEILKALNQTYSRPIVWTLEDYKSKSNEILSTLINEISDEKTSPDKLKIFEGKRNSASGKNIIKLHYTANRWLGTKNRQRAKYRINKYFNESNVFFGNLLPNPIDITLETKFDTIPSYQKETTEIKESSDYIVFP